MVITMCVECGKEYELEDDENPGDFQCECGGELINSESIEDIKEDSSKPGSTIKCSTCGTENPIYANFCGECRGKIVLETTLDENKNNKSHILKQNQDRFNKLIQFWIDHPDAKQLIEREACKGKSGVEIGGIKLEESLKNLYAQMGQSELYEKKMKEIRRKLITPDVDKKIMVAVAILPEFYDFSYVDLDDSLKEEMIGIFAETFENNPNCGSREILTQILKKTNLDREIAEKIAFTELFRIISFKKYYKYQFSGREYFIVQTVPDCCDKCYNTYNGCVFNIQDDLSKLPPLHPYCKCSVNFIRSEEHAKVLANEFRKERLK